MFLTSPFIDQAITLTIPSMSAIGIFQHLTAGNFTHRQLSSMDQILRDAGTRKRTANS